MRRMTFRWVSLFVCFVMLMRAQVHGVVNVNITILESASSKGAVCLDGSPPAYAYLEGSANGHDSWIVFMEGGGWCNTIDDCLNRRKLHLGSSHKMANKTYFSGLLDDDCTINPDFCNWNKVFIYYCDGASFLSDVETINPQNNLTFRGARIFNVMMEEMLGKGMLNARNAILTGTSAGGLTTILHCDKFRALMPNTSKTKCVSDSGFFIHGKGLPGVEMRENYFAGVVATNGLANYLPASCTTKMKSGLCFFPEYLVGDVQTPLFLIESAFDSYQVEHNLVPAVGGIDEWNKCLKNLIMDCNATQIKILKDFRSAFVETLMKLDKSSSRGMFIHSCYRHGHVGGREGWTCSSAVGNVLANKTIGQAVGDWFFDRTSFSEIDMKNTLPRNCTIKSSGPSFDQGCLLTI